MFRYTVRCEFVSSDETPREWLDWMRAEHLAEVLEAGAESAEVVRMDGEPTAFEVRYQFASRERFDQYEAEHAPRLRAEGLARFPLARGLSYTRTTGEVVVDPECFGK